MKYLLNEKIPIPCTDFIEWATKMETNNRTVAKTEINDILISTIFLGLDHGFGKGDPILFETMIFGGKHDQYQERYETWEEAEKGHKRAVELVKKLPWYKFSWKRFLLMIGVLIFIIIAVSLNKKIFTKTSIWSWEYYKF